VRTQRRSLAIFYGVSFLTLATMRSQPAAEEPKAVPKGQGLKLKVELPDGDKWVLGENGIGRPFLARLTLSNQGEEDIRVWNPTGSEGRVSPSIVLTNSKTTRQFLLRPHFVNRTTGPATFEVIKPHESIGIDLELLRLVDEECSPSAGNYNMSAYYQNEIERGGIVKDIWKGRIMSETHEIQIVAPATSPDGWLAGRLADGQRPRPSFH